VPRDFVYVGSEVRARDGDWREKEMEEGRRKLDGSTVGEIVEEKEGKTLKPSARHRPCGLIRNLHSCFILIDINSSLGN
jgi:hypothetical protein